MTGTGALMGVHQPASLSICGVLRLVVLIVEKAELAEAIHMPAGQAIGSAWIDDRRQSGRNRLARSARFAGRRTRNRVRHGRLRAAGDGVSEVNS